METGIHETLLRCHVAKLERIYCHAVQLLLKYLPDESEQRRYWVSLITHMDQSESVCVHQEQSAIEASDFASTSGSLVMGCGRAFDVMHDAHSRLQTPTRVAEEHPQGLNSKRKRRRNNKKAGVDTAAGAADGADKGGQEGKGGKGGKGKGGKGGNEAKRVRFNQSTSEQYGRDPQSSASGSLNSTARRQLALGSGGWAGNEWITVGTQRFRTDLARKVTGVTTVKSFKDWTRGSNVDLDKWFGKDGAGGWASIKRK